MRLFEHEDFQEAITAAAASTDLSEPFLEKDYYITEVLRLIAERYGEKVIFKGGTSLSKGWDLIQRLSEDVDLLVVRDRFEPALGKARSETELATMKDVVDSHPGLSWSEEDSLKFGGSRRDVFAYDPRFRTPALAPTVMTEPGVAGGDRPTEDLQIESHLARFVRTQGQEDMADDTTRFGVTTLHFRRTFVEKLFLIHALVERLKEKGTPLGRDARHYYDLHALASEEQVRRMLRSSDYKEIKNDCEQLSQKFFRKKYRRPPNLSFATSDGLFPSTDLRAQIEPDYAEQCGLLCYGEVPPFDRVVGRLEELRDQL
ncbi:MAG: nucleotidyl transferase AbiEii/AbiGii toxin family protein [Actinomycetota bacterium]